MSLRRSRKRRAIAVAKILPTRKTVKAVAATKAAKGAGKTAKKGAKAVAATKAAKAAGKSAKKGAEAVAATKAAKGAGKAAKGARKAARRRSFRRPPARVLAIVGLAGAAVAAARRRRSRRDDLGYGPPNESVPSHEMLAGARGGS
jgi:hypothetical protein